jgi:predicted negative regulator of RcsB-dependent stress response
MNRNNTLYFIVGALVIGLIVVGYFVYQDRNRDVMRIEIGEDGVSVDGR